MRQRILSFFFVLQFVFPAWALADEVRIMAFGDSLSAGYRLAPEEGFAPVLQEHLREMGVAALVKNAAVSGATTADGRTRLSYALKWEPDLVILELGANDALRAFNPAVTRGNLDAMLADILGRRIDVLLAGMYAPRNLGDQYAAEFDSIYPDLADKHGVALYPFFLEGVALNPELNLDDALHPNAEGVRTIVRNIAPHVVKVLEGRG